MTISGRGPGTWRFVIDFPFDDPGYSGTAGSGAAGRDRRDAARGSGSSPGCRVSCPTSGCGTCAGWSSWTGCWRARASGGGRCRSPVRGGPGPGQGHPGKPADSAARGTAPGDPGGYGAAAPTPGMLGRGQSRTTGPGQPGPGFSPATPVGADLAAAFGNLVDQAFSAPIPGIPRFEPGDAEVTVRDLSAVYAHVRACRRRSRRPGPAGGGYHRSAPGRQRALGVGSRRRRISCSAMTGSARGPTSSSAPPRATAFSRRIRSTVAGRGTGSTRWCRGSGCATRSPTWSCWPGRRCGPGVVPARQRGRRHRSRVVRPGDGTAARASARARRLEDSRVPRRGDPVRVARQSYLTAAGVAGLAADIQRRGRPRDRTRHRPRRPGEVAYQHLGSAEKDQETGRLATARAGAAADSIPCAARRRQGRPDRDALWPGSTAWPPRRRLANRSLRRTDVTGALRLPLGPARPAAAAAERDDEHGAGPPPARCAELRERCRSGRVRGPASMRCACHRPTRQSSTGLPSRVRPASRAAEAGPGPSGPRRPRVRNTVRGSEPDERHDHAADRFLRAAPGRRSWRRVAGRRMTA